MAGLPALRRSRRRLAGAANAAALVSGLCAASLKGAKVEDLENSGNREGHMPTLLQGLPLAILD